MHLPSMVFSAQCARVWRRSPLPSRRLGSIFTVLQLARPHPPWTGDPVAGSYESRSPSTRMYTCSTPEPVTCLKNFPWPVIVCFPLAFAFNGAVSNAQRAAWRHSSLPSKESAGIACMECGGTQRGQQSLPSPGVLRARVLAPFMISRQVLLVHELRELWP